MSGRRIVCVCCDVEGPTAGRGLISACYLRCWRQGTLDQFPIDAESRLQRGRELARRGREAYSRIAADRVEEYVFLRSCGVDLGGAAKRLGVRPSTAQRYERILAEQRSAMTYLTTP